MSDYTKNRPDWTWRHTLHRAVLTKDFPIDFSGIKRVLEAGSKVLVAISDDPNFESVDESEEEGITPYNLYIAFDDGAGCICAIYSDYFRLEGR